MKDTFSSAELTALRNDLIHHVLIDSRDSAELLQLFLMGRGFGASPEAARRRGPCREIRLLDPRAAKRAGGPCLGHVSGHLEIKGSAGTSEPSRFRPAIAPPNFPSRYAKSFR
jgi:hypothetical protein